MADTIIIKEDQDKKYCLTRISEIKPDGLQEVTFKKTAMDSTTKQRRLQWKWYTEVSQSGLGQDDDKNAVHVRAKMMFAHPILMRDDEVYPVLYEAFKDAVRDSGDYAAYIKEFSNQYISTERMTKQQRAEFLTEFQRYWIGNGANLCDPSLQGCDLDKMARK